MRLRATDHGMSLEVLIVSWSGPHTPIAEWREYATFPHLCDAALIYQAMEALLKDKAYFQRCKECKTVHLNGHMFSATLCQSCASHTLGVVY